MSGASSLVYEIVWLRWLVQIFGVTTLAVSTVLTAFMAGLAAGSWAAGRLGPRLDRPIRAYGALELTIGALALVVPFGLNPIVPMLHVLGLDEATAPVALALVRVALAAALLCLPTMCMGATLPLLAEAVAARSRDGGVDAIGRLYAANIAGGVLGTAATGFLLLPAVGVSRTNGLAAALNMGIGLAALWIDRRSAGLARRPGGPDVAAAAPSVHDSVGPTFADFVAGGTVALSGALAMVYEVAWSRALALVLGSSVYAFTVVLSTVLLGLAAGSYLGARRVDGGGTAGLPLAFCHLGIGLTALGGLAALGELPYLFLRLVALSARDPARLYAFEVLLAGAVVLGPAVCLGAVFPLAVRLAGRPERRIGSAVGTLYALNSAGAVVGSFVGGFILVPGVGIQRTILGAVLLNLVVASFLLLTFPGRRPGLASMVGGALLGLALGAAVMTPPWSREIMTSGAAVHAPRLEHFSRRALRAYAHAARLIFYEEGLTTTVSVESRGGVMALRVDGKPDASTGGVDMANQVLLGHLPMLFHAGPREALVIGLGSGVSSGSALRHPVRALTVVELEPAVVRASRLFDDVNRRPLEDPRARLVTTDARSFLRLTRNRFDVVISEPSNPWMTVAASLFTEDFFQLVRARMRPGGVFAQWLQLYSLTPETLRTLVATFTSVFPETVIFRTSRADLVLVGSLEPISADYERLAGRLRHPSVAADLGQIGVRSVGELLARLLLDVEDVARFSTGTRLNTEDNARVEFQAPLALYLDTIDDNVEALATARRGTGSLYSRIMAGAPAAARRTLGVGRWESGAPDEK